jgi:hypothetical protein
MKQSERQLPVLHTWPAPQLVPSFLLDQVVVELAGVHTWQALPGLDVPAE